MPTVTVKMSPRQFARLKQIARERRMPKAQVLREAFERAGDSAVSGSMYDLIADLTGSVEGPSDLSINRKFLEGYGLDGPARRKFWRRMNRRRRK
jgi:hypothetical protein